MNLYLVIYEYKGKRYTRSAHAYSSQQAKAEVMPYRSKFIDIYQITGEF